MDKTVGIIGLGIMGGAIASNLVEREWHVVGFDTDPAKCAELAEAGVAVVESVALAPSTPFDTSVAEPSSFCTPFTTS